MFIEIYMLVFEKYYINIKFVKDNYGIYMKILDLSRIFE